VDPQGDDFPIKQFGGDKLSEPLRGDRLVNDGQQIHLTTEELSH